LAERRLVDRRVADHLTTTPILGVAGKPVLEDRDVVVRLGDLGLGAAGSGRAQRAELRRWMVGAVLAPGRDRHPFPQQRVPAQVAHVGGLDLWRSYRIRYRPSALWTTLFLSRRCAAFSAACSAKGDPHRLLCRVGHAQALQGPGVQADDGPSLLPGQADLAERAPAATDGDDAI